MWMNFLFSSCNEFNVFQKKHNLWYLSIKENCPKIIIVVHILILLKQKIIFLYLYFYSCSNLFTTKVILWNGDSSNKWGIGLFALTIRYVEGLWQM